MSAIPVETTLRIARPSRDLTAAEEFWVGGVGLQVIERVRADGDGERNLLMVGIPDARWHLELVQDPEALADHPPSAEDLLVIYLGNDVPHEWLARLEEHGSRRVRTRNPYWERWGVTVVDPDGYRLVLSSRSWD
ncbi:VOC family protein [Nocardioides jensenii]|uniref:VOC family protein n=1 Tax=Nocardioides jensenii TaxID=1843 RepID=UPI000B264B71|nr:VOC family protein [Nocardioides jensenii]